MSIITLFRKESVSPDLASALEIDLPKAFPPMSLTDKRADRAQKEIDRLDAEIQDLIDRMEGARISHEDFMARSSKTRDELMHIRKGMARFLADLTGYDAEDDARKSYDVAIEAKRLRGDQHYPEKAAAE